MSGKRRLKKMVSRILAVLLLCDISLMISAALFHFGVYDQAVLAQSFEKSGYYEMFFEEAQAELFTVLDEAGIPDSALNVSDLELSFERRMRSQVLNRSDSAVELSGISMAKEILDWAEGQKLDLTLRAQEGIVRLSERLSRILYDKSEILGLDGWYGDANLFSKRLPQFLKCLGFLFFVATAFIGYLQSRKYRFFTNLAASLAGAALVGVIQSGIVSLLIQPEMGQAMGLVMAAYRREIAFVGLKISAAVFVIAVMLDVSGLVMKKMQQR